MIQSGYTPRKIKDSRNYSFPRTFGVADKSFLDQAVDYDAGLTMPDQIAEGLPLGCTGETTTDIGTDYDGIVYQAGFTYHKTCQFEGHPPNQGCEIQNALKVSSTYGLLAVGETTDIEALGHLRGKRFEIHPTDGYDWFDALRSALILNPKRSLSIGTPWFKEWDVMHVRPDGIVPEGIFRGSESWHNWKISGIVNKNGEWMLKGKSWQGRRYGDNGFHYLSRTVVNSAMSIRGSEAWNQARAEKEDIKTIQMNAFERVISLFIKLFKEWSETATPPTPPVVISAPPPIIPKQNALMDGLEKMATFIRDYEGNPGDLNYRNNNPGNCKYSPVGYDPKYGMVRRDKNNFAIFATYELGFLYLKNLIRAKGQQHTDWTIYDYIAKFHAPKSDGNDPVKYATNIASRLGVDMYYPLSKIINT